MALHAAEPMGTRPSGQGTRRVTARFRRDVTQTVAMTGRFAPSPTGALHVGNLRTALIAWLAARSAGERFVLRMEDLDRVTSSAAHERSQERDLAAVGIDWDGAVWRQSERFGVYDAAILRLTELGMTYDCFCSRREIREAVAAPHGPDTLVYPGTCRDLTREERIRRGRSRRPAVRFRAGPDFIAIDDAVAGRYERPAHDVVLRRNDGAPAYNVAVVIDDHAQGIDQVVRGDDLLSATPSQVAIAAALDIASPGYVHVPLVVGESGERLAKRDGAITLDQLASAGWDVDRVRAALAVSIGVAESGEAVTAAQLVGRFDLDRFASRAATPVALENVL